MHRFPDVSNAALYQSGGEAFYMDEHFKNVLCFKATPELVRAILVDRNCDEHKFGCNPGCLQAGPYVQPVFYGKEPLTATTKTKFGHNLLVPKKKPNDRQARSQSSTRR